MNDAQRGDGVFKVRPRDHNEYTIQVPVLAAGQYYRRFVEDGGKKIVFERV